MNGFLKKSMMSTIIVATGLLSGFSSAYAATYRLTFDKVIAYDDGDYKPDGAGEITFDFSINSERVFHEKMSLDDRGNDTYNFNLVKDITVPDGQFVTVTARGSEYDKYSRNEMCDGSVVISPTNTGAKVLDCGKSNGELGLFLEFNATKLD